MSGGEAREDRAEGARGEFGVGRGGGGRSVSAAPRTALAAALVCPKD